LNSVKQSSGISACCSCNSRKLHSSLCRRRVLVAESLFDHTAAQVQFGDSVFWLRRLACLEGEQAAVEYWQVKRGGGWRGIIEIIGEKP
jgi:hypothetical protein